MKQSALNAYLNVVTNRPGWVILACAVITIGLAWQLPDLSFKTSVYDLVIEDLDEADRYRQFVTRFGADEIIRLVVKAADILDPATFAKVTQLSDAASRIDGVIRIISLPEVKASVDRGNAWDMRRFAAVLAPVELFRRNLIAADGRSTIITLVLDAQADKATVIASVERLIATSSTDLRLYQTGMPLVSKALADYTRTDFFRLTPITLAVIALLLALLLRNRHGVMLPLVCVAMAGCWTFGIMALCGIAVSMLTIIVPVFLIAVGTAYCLHICSEYLQQVCAAASPRDASLATFRHMALPVSLAVGTTMIGLLSLGINRITAIREFALFASVGMVSLLVIALTLFPAMLAWMPPPRRPSTAPSMVDRAFDRVLNGIVDLNLKHRKYSLLAIGLVMLICAFGMLHLRVETNPVSFFKRSTDVSRHFHDIYREMSGSFPLNVVMTGNAEDYFESPANVAALAGLQAYLETLPGVDKTISLADYLKLVNYATNQFDPQYYVLPQDGYAMRMLMNNFKIILGNDLLQRFLSPDYRRANILMLTHIANSGEFIRTREEILRHARDVVDADASVEVTGLGMVIAASSHQLTLGQVKSLAISLVLIFGVMAVLFLSSKVGLIAVVPNLFPIVVNFGVMGLAGIPLSMATSLIASVAIGLAVDDTIHYLVRYNTEFKRDLDKDRAMRDTLMQVGRPIIFTTLIISLGFAVLLFSHFQPTATFGLLMVVTMIAALIGDVILLPALMLHVELVTAWDLLKMMPTVGGISPATMHELNQPLNAIKVGSDLLKMMARQQRPLKASQLAAIAGEIGSQVARASQMIQRLGDMGRMPGTAKAPLDLRGPIADTLAFIDNQLRLEAIRLSTSLPADLPPIMGHHARLVQVVYNLLDNAREAIARKREREGDDQSHVITVSAAVVDDAVVVTISDTGDGIPDHHLERIFEPFFTTKTAGTGKGLGLSISQQIVRDLGGRISVTSRSGQGTTATLRFPRLPPTA